MRPELVFVSRVTIAKRFKFSDESINRAMIPYLEAEERILDSTKDEPPLRLKILRATADILRKDGITVPAPSILLVGSSEASLESTALSYGLDRLRELGAEMPPRPLVAVEVIGSNLISPESQDVEEKCKIIFSPGDNLDEADQDKVIDFCVHNDYLEGMSGVLSSIVTGFNYRRGKSPDQLQSSLLKWNDLFGDFFGTERSLADTANDYVGILAKYSRFTQSLEDDPTGFGLIDSSLENIVVPEYEAFRHLFHQAMVAGAKFSSKLYKAIYPFTDQTTPT